jgi:glycosyltransferase involved in cell wall biosynthesis
MGKPLTFSVGIPAYNQAEFLGETIESLLHQTRPPDEIVVSDHYSSDHTAEVIARYARHVRGVRPPVGSNVGAQWAFTLSQLHGDWVTLFSSDDVARPNFCEVLLRGAARREDAVLVRAGWQNIDLTGAVVSTEYLLSVKAVTLPPETILEQRHGPKASFAAFAVKRDVLARAGGYPVAMESFGDWPMFMQLAPFGSFLYENELIAGYRVGHDGNKFRKRLGMWVRDEQRMFYEVMPLAAERAGLADRSWIAEASRENYMRYLASASREFAPHERAEIAPLFECWAARVGGEPELRGFAAGESVKLPVSLIQRGKRLVRPLAQQLYARMRKA